MRNENFGYLPLHHNQNILEILIMTTIFKARTREVVCYRY